MPLRVCAVTGSRADWNFLAPVLRRLRDDPGFDLSIVVTGQHLHGSARESVDEIGRQGFSALHFVDMGLDKDTPAGLSAGLGRAVAGLGEAYASLRPDLLLIVGDRYEMLGAAAAALLFLIPIAHIGGGDITEGAFDDATRHAITKLSHLHFPSNEEAGARLARLGEQPDRIFVVGSPALETLHETPRLARDEVLRRAKLPTDSDAELLVVTFHPPTLSADGATECAELLAALSALEPEPLLLFTGVNLDPGASTIAEQILDFCGRHPNAVVCGQLGPQGYYSAVAHAAAVVGNSSSGIYEVPSLGRPTVNIGDRQKGRPRACSVIDCPADRVRIAAAIRQARGMDLLDVANPYGDQSAAERIWNVLKSIDDPRSLVRKSFHSAA